MPTNAGRQGLRLGLLLEHLVIGAIVVALAIGLQHALSLSALYMWKVVAAVAGGGALTLALATRHLAASTLGAANLVTLARGGLVGILLGLMGEGEAGWSALVLSATVLSLDGVDGWVARRLNLSTAFGARFDMETDALALLAVSALVWQQGKAGPWVVLAGLMRYAFMAAAKAVPRLAGPLPPSWRRKSAFVLAATTLIVCLAPIVTPPLSIVLVLTGLCVLTASFAIDVAYLCDARRATQI